ncbi:hypothetical protein [Comamonas composti]|uniref:hypothetical protein n=1 Tax=Comamonas composti TaxID=408558 RepID=UPI001FE1B3AA|nr:hypothetical protein [Comamonas composti]
MALATVILLGPPVARSMAHGLNQACRQRTAPASPWTCTAPGPDEALPPAGRIFLLGQDWRSADPHHAGLLQFWRARLQAQGRDYQVLYGTANQQWKQLREVLQFLEPDGDWSWLETPALDQPQAERPMLLRPAGCEQCGDPECERRLFDALRTQC